MDLSKVDSLRKTVEFKRHGILKLNSVKECSKEFQKIYVFVLANKATNNIIVVCITTWKSFARSLGFGQALQVVTLAFLKPCNLKK